MKVCTKVLFDSDSYRKETLFEVMKFYVFFSNMLKIMKAKHKKVIIVSVPQRQKNKHYPTDNATLISNNKWKF